MAVTLPRPVEAVVHLAVPVFGCLVLLTLSALPLHLPFWAAVSPNLLLMAVFYWAVFRPDRLPLVAIFALGVVEDALIGAPIGINAIILVLTYGFVLSQQRIFQSATFGMMWVAFALVSAAASIVGWLMISAYAFQLLDPVPEFFHWALTAALYPFVAWVLGRIQHALMQSA